jgi:hypothetical protein
MTDGLTPFPGNWDEPAAKVLERLMNNAMFAADSEALKKGPPSRIRNPDGSQQGETPHERTTRVVRAALRMLLANGLITALPPEEWPEYVILDPPSQT